MIPYSYNMVDMNGIDLAEANGTVVPGIYEKIVEAMNLCGDLIIYNWKFAEIEIAPSAYSVLQQDNSIMINGLIQVTELDQITVIGLPPPIVPVSPLEVTENGVYQAQSPASGFNPVRVQVPPPVIVPITFTENGVYPIGEGVNGYGPITVDVDNQVVQEVPYDVEYEQGTAQGAQQSYSANKMASSTRIRPVNLVPLVDYSGQQVLAMFNQGYNIAFQWYNSNGIWVTGNSWMTSYFLSTISYPNLVILIRHSNDSVITVDELDDVGLRLVLTSSL